MNKKRPINLDLGSLKYPPMAIASILHRISGLVLFLLLPLMLYFLNLSLRSEASFDQLQMILIRPEVKGVLWIFCAALVYHLVAGIRHLFMDMGFAEQLDAGRRSAIAVMLIALVATIFLGFWIW